MTVGKSLKFLKTMISIVSYVFWDEKSTPYVYKTLSSLGGRGPHPCPFMGISLATFMFNQLVK